MVRPTYVVVVLLVLLALSNNLAAQTTELTYQGQLQSSSAAAGGVYDFEFALFDGAGTQIGPVLTRSGVTVTNGVFSVNLDFGSSFPGASRFLEIRVRQSSSGPYTTLSPRQPLTSAPYSIKTLAADNATQLGGLPANQYLQTDGNGSSLSNLNATSITTGTLANARLGQIPTANIADSAVTSPKIAGGQVVKSVNSLTDNVMLAAGSNITITPAGNTLTIASTGAGIGGAGTTNSIPLWTAGATLGNSVIQQSEGRLRIVTDRLAINQFQQRAAGLSTEVFDTLVNFGINSGREGTFNNAHFGYWLRADIREGENGFHFFKKAASSGAESLLLRITDSGNVGVGTPSPFAKLQVVTANDTAPAAIAAWDSRHFVMGGSGSSGGIGFSYDQTNRVGHIGALSPNVSWGNLILQSGGGNVGIGTTTPATKLEVNGYTKLGSDAPSIKVKKLTGTTSPSHNCAFLAHGLDITKILAVSVMVNSSGNRWDPPSFLLVNGYHFTWVIDTGGIQVCNVENQSFNILSKPIKILITYEQ